MDEDEFYELIDRDPEQAKGILIDKRFYQINGLFNQPPFEEEYSSFWGYFITEESGNLFLGELFDKWGDSYIRGEFGESDFHMVKQYFKNVVRRLYRHLLNIISRRLQMAFGLESTLLQMQEQETAYAE